MKRKDYGVLLIIIALVFAFAETQHFGQNWTAMSLAEFISDALSVAVALWGAYLIATSRK